MFALLYATSRALIGRIRKRTTLYKYSHATDWMFIVLLFLTSLTGLIMHALHLLQIPMATYYMSVIHLALAVPMIAVEVPFAKWSHLAYRPCAAYFDEIRKEAAKLPENQEEATKSTA